MKFLYTGYSGYYFSYTGTVFICSLDKAKKINSFSGKDVVGQYVTIYGELSDVYANSTFGKELILAVKNL